MTCVAIVSKPRKQELAQLLPELIDWLRKHNYNPLLDREGANYTDAAPAVDRSDMPAHRPELVIVLGGDGTFSPWRAFLPRPERLFSALTSALLASSLKSVSAISIKHSKAGATTATPLTRAPCSTPKSCAMARR